MSDGPTDQVPPSFFDLYSRGEVSAETIDDWVGRWHWLAARGIDPA